MDPELFAATGTVIDPEFEITGAPEPTACTAGAMGSVMDPGPPGGSCLELDWIGVPLGAMGGKFIDPPAPACCADGLHGITTALAPSWHSTAGHLGVLP